MLNKLKDKLNHKVRKYLQPNNTNYFKSALNNIKQLVGRTSLGNTNLEYLNTLTTYQLASINPIVGACIRAECDKIVGLKWKLRPNNPEIVNEAELEFLTDVFNNPHGITDNTDFNDYLVSWVKNYELTGNAFVEIQYTNNNVNGLNDINALNIIDTEDLTYDTQSNQFCLKDNPQITYDQFHLIQSRNRDVFNPKEVFGYSKLDEINKQLKVMISGLEYNTKTLTNGGINPRTVFSYPIEMSRDDFLEELNLFNKMSEKAKEEGKQNTIAMKGVTVQSTGVTNSDMEFKDMYIQCVQDVCACLGVPPSIIGFNLSTHSSEKQDTFTFNVKIMSLIRIFERVHNNILKNLGYSYHLSFEELVTRDLKAEFEMYAMALWNGFFTPNDLRDIFGLDYVSWGDVPFNNNYNDNVRKAKNFGNLQNHNMESDEVSVNE